MREIVLLWVGRRGAPAIEALAAEYGRRIRRHAAFREVRVRPEAGRERDPARAREREGERLLAHLAPGDTLVALDEGGTLRSTGELAGFLDGHLQRGRLVFAVGSDLGLDPLVLAAAREVMSLSPLTLSHELARVVLTEQLYRCLDLLAGGPYHRGDRAAVGYNHPRRRPR